MGQALQYSPKSYQHKRRKGKENLKTSVLSNGSTESVFTMVIVTSEMLSHELKLPAQYSQYSWNCRKITDIFVSTFTMVSPQLIPLEKSKRVVLYFTTTIKIEFQFYFS